MKTDSISPRRADKRIHVALPLRLSCPGTDRSRLIMACTYDISSRGARIGAGQQPLKVGDTIAIERGRNKVSCRVAWVGDTDSKHRGVVGIEFADASKSLWESELKELEQMYDRLPRRANQPGEARPGSQERERRAHHRVMLKSPDQVLNAESGKTYTTGCLQNLSEYGCLIVSDRPLAQGSDLDLILKVAGCELNFRAEVRHAASTELGIEFREVRKGDRERLQYLLQTLDERQLEEYFEVTA
jgi:hypothetical protein